MKPHEEFHLFQTDWASWAKQTAPKIKAKYATASEKEKAEVWARLSDKMKDEIRKLGRGE